MPPVIAALRKHKVGVFLIALQVALTLAVVCNVVFIVALQAKIVDQPTGIKERDLFLIGQSWTDVPTGTAATVRAKLDSMQRTDLATLRGLSEVADATPITSLPAIGTNNSITGVSLKPSQPHGFTSAALFFGDEQIVPTLGLRMLAGRDFTSTDVQRDAQNGKTAPPVVIISHALACKLFPGCNAVGRPIYLGIGNNTSPSTVIGVVARLLTSEVGGEAALAYHSVLVPARIDAASTLYAVRAKSGQLNAAIRAARTALFRVDPLRIMQPRGTYSLTGLHTYAKARHNGHAMQIYTIQILTTIAVILLAVTGVGMAGMTSFWVGQRHKQIGIQRALGATRINILHYFQIENLLITGAGCVVGVILAIGINLILLSMFAFANRMPVWYLVAGIVVILLVGQFAVFMPARRASKVPPVVATRTV